MSKHLGPAVPQTTISAACYVGELCSGALCSLSRLASGAAVCKPALGASAASESDHQMLSVTLKEIPCCATSQARIQSVAFKYV